MKIIKTLNEFNEEIKEGKVLVDFFASWCGPCKMISPIIEELSTEITDVKFIKVDVDQASDIASTHGIMSIPTLMLFDGGKLIDKTVGFINKEEIINFIRR